MKLPRGTYLWIRPGGNMSKKHNSKKRWKFLNIAIGTAGFYSIILGGFLALFGSALGNMLYNRPVLFAILGAVLGCALGILVGIRGGRKWVRESSTNKAASGKIPPAGEKWRQSLSRLAFVFSGMGFLLGLLVMSPDGRFFGFVIMAASALVPLIVGPKSYRVYGGAALLIGAVGIAWLYDDFQTGPYRLRAKVHEAFSFGSACTVAAEKYWRPKHEWPSKPQELGLEKISYRSVKSVRLGPGGTITVLLSFPPLKDKSLIFTPSVNGDSVQWECFGNDIPVPFLPSGCR